MASEQSDTMEQKKPRRLRRIIGRLAAVLVTGTVIAASGGIIWQSTGLIAERAAAVEKPPATEPVLVETSPINIVETYSLERSFSGQIEAPQLADLSFEQGGTIEFIGVDEGEAIAKGQVVARLDARILQAEHRRLEASKAAIEAQRELMTLDNERAAELNKRGFAATQTLDQTRLGLVELGARIAEIDAGIASIDIQLEKLTIKAPFDGIVSGRLVDPGTTIGVGQPVLSLIEDENPVFRVGIDPQLANSLSVGDTVPVTFGDKTIEAEIISFLPQLDPTTRTRTVRAQLPGGAGASIGETGEVTLSEVVEATGAWIPLSAIEDGVRGLWTIKTVKGESEQTVAIEAVELIHVDEQKAFVRGSFTADSEFITTGLHRIAAGQPIKTENQ